MSYSGQCVDTSVGLVLLEEERAAELQAGGDDAGRGITFQEFTWAQRDGFKVRELGSLG